MMKSQELSRMLAPPPPWEVLNLVANYLDPEALAIASCVNKSWSTTMSSDHLWEPICSALYPSLFNLHLHAAAASSSSYGSFRRLYSLGRLANNRRVQKPLKPKLSLKDIIFAIDIYNNDSCISTILKNGYDLQVDKNGIFRFDIDMDDDDDEKVVVVKGIDKLRITWNVILEGFKSVFSMMECNGKGSFVLGLEGWFSKELPPSSGCCCSGGKSGVVADLRLGLREVNGEMVVEKISVGVLSIVSWRYVCIDDALRYLQHFLL